MSWAELGHIVMTFMYSLGMLVLGLFIVPGMNRAPPFQTVTGPKSSRKPLVVAAKAGKVAAMLECQVPKFTS